MTAAWVLDEDDALDVLAFLVTAARTQVDEAREYGPMRLLMAAHRLADAMGPRCDDTLRAFLDEQLAAVPALALPRGEGADDYVDRLDGLGAALGTLLADRYAGRS